MGAEKELKTAIKAIDKSKVLTEVAKRELEFEWKFNPPISPWMGGAWESLIKSVKKALKTITRDRLFTEESLHTFLCEVESIVNQRPLTPSSDDIRDYEALTPNHVLIGNHSQSFSPGHFIDDEIDYKRKWRSVQAAANMFWNRWIKEYLPTLQIRPKWTRKSRNMLKGDLVIVETNNTPRSHWPLGRVIETFPGKDGITRVVKVKTPNMELMRPVAKLCLLEKLV